METTAPSLKHVPHYAALSDGVIGKWNFCLDALLMFVICVFF